MLAQEIETIKLKLDFQEGLDIANVVGLGDFRFGIEGSVGRKLSQNLTSPSLTKEEIIGCLMHIEGAMRHSGVDQAFQQRCQRLIDKLEKAKQPKSQ